MELITIELKLETGPNIGKTDGPQSGPLHLNIWATVRPRQKGYYHVVPKENQGTTGATLTDSSANSFIRSVEWGNEKGEKERKKKLKKK